MGRSPRVFVEGVWKGDTKVIARWEWLEKVGLLIPGEEGYTPGIYNDCLLYTSPSPRDQRGSRMPSSA